MHTINLLLSSIIFALTKSTLTIAGPIYAQAQSQNLTITQLESIAPTSTTCYGAPFPQECAVSAQALPDIVESFQQYYISSPAEQAALISLMAFESGEFKYNRNHFPAPGRPGQGTRNMQSATFNAKYAASIPALQDKLQSVPATTGPLDLLLSNPAYDFGSAAWFLTTQCSSDVRAALQTGSEAGWEMYISQCVSTTVTSDRKAYWTKAVQVLGV